MTKVKRFLCKKLFRILIPASVLIFMYRMFGLDCYLTRKYYALLSPCRNKSFLNEKMKNNYCCFIRAKDKEASIKPNKGAGTIQTYYVCTFVN